jgi:type IV fimbrial biogenesis protein FimT
MLIPAFAPRPGFSLIELMVAITVMTLLMLAGMPALGTWVADSRIRSVAESLQNGLRVAQASAIERNRRAVFALTASTPSLTAKPAANQTHWYARLLSLDGSDEADSDADAAKRFLRGSSDATMAGVSITGPALVCFGPLGRQISLDSSATGLDTACTAADPVTYIVTSASNSGARKLQVQVNLGGRVRMCDPAKQLSQDNPDGC